MSCFSRPNFSSIATLPQWTPGADRPRYQAPSGPIKSSVQHPKDFQPRAPRFNPSHVNADHVSEKTILTQVTVDTDAASFELVTLIFVIFDRTPDHPSRRLPTL